MWTLYGPQWLVRVPAAADVGVLVNEFSPWCGWLEGLLATIVDVHVGKALSSLSGAGVALRSPGPGQDCPPCMAGWEPLWNSTWQGRWV